jgi:hypothetical protein
MPLKTFRLTGHLPGEIQELVTRRIKDLRYPTDSAYVNGLVLFDLFCKRDHRLTAPLMREPQWVRDKVIEQLVQDFDRPDADHKRPGGWFEERIKEVVDEEKRRARAAAGKKAAASTKPEGGSAGAKKSAPAEAEKKESPPPKERKKASIPSVE